MGRRGRQASRATLWGFLGALLLAAGCFTPIAARPGGTITLLSTGSILPRLILVAALSSVALLLLRRRRALLIPGAAAGLMVLVEFLSFQETLAVVSGASSSAGAILSSFVNEWGWALLVGGIALLLLAGLFPGRRRRPAGDSAGTRHRRH
ncbi:MAG: hypothetical protein ABFC89_04100 [Methanospirillum sp.]